MIDQKQQKKKAYMKNSRSDAERFARYQAVLDALVAKESFLKAEIHPAFKREDKTFIGAGSSPSFSKTVISAGTVPNQVHHSPGRREGKISTRAGGLISAFSRPQLIEPLHLTGRGSAFSGLARLILRLPNSLQSL